MTAQTASLPAPYYEEPGITIYNADCRDVLPYLPKVDLVLTDPPYGVELIGYSGLFDDTQEYVKQVIVPVIKDCIQKSVTTVVTCGIRCIFFYPPSDDIGCIFNPAGAGRSRWGFSCFSPILYYGKDPYIRMGLGGRPNSMWDVRSGDGINGHPCPKPQRWMQWLIQRASLEGTVLDPFMGSGTTLVAAKQLGRQAIGIEIERKYCDIAIERLRQEMLPFDPLLPQPEQLEFYV
jgi:DNA modification methylase